MIKLELQRSRVLKAWLLILVFTPILVLSSLHVHTPESGHETGCEACLKHVKHVSHLDAMHADFSTCLLCQYHAISFMPSALLVFTAFVAVFSLSVLLAECSRFVGYARLSLPRAPPFYL